MIQEKRKIHSAAHIDSTLVAAFIVGLVTFATWIAWETSGVINPWWLGGSIIALGIYQLMIFWMMSQYWDAHRIFTIFTINIASLGLLLGLIGLVLDIRLPVDLPVLNATLHIAGIEATSFSPGAVALSYTVAGLFVGYIFLLIAMLVENTRPIVRLKSVLKLDRLDHAIDNSLDAHGFWLENSRLFWIGAPMLLLAIVAAIVVGAASLI